MTIDGRQAAVCPDDELLGAFVEGRLDGARHAEVERHVGECAGCLDVVAATVPVRSKQAAPTAPVAASAPARRAASPGWRRWALAASLTIVAGGLLLVAAERPLPGLGTGLSRLASRWLGMNVHVGAVAVGLPGPGTFVIKLNDVRFGRDVDLFRADEVKLTVGLAALASGESPLRELRLVRPFIEVARPESLAFAWSSDQGERVFATLGDADRVDIVEGRLVVRGTTDGSVAIERISGGLDRDADGAAVVLHGRVGDGDLDVDGTLASDRSRLALTIGGRNLEARTIPTFADRLTGVADLRVDVTWMGGELRVDGRVALRQGSFIGLGPTRLLQLQGASRNSLAIAAPSLAGDDLPFDAARAVFAWRRGVWRLPRVFVTNGAVIAGGRLRVAADEVTGHGTVRLPPDFVRDVGPHAPELAGYLEQNGAATLPFAVEGSTTAPRFTIDGR